MKLILASTGDVQFWNSLFKIAGVILHLIYYFQSIGEFLALFRYVQNCQQAWMDGDILWKVLWEWLWLEDFLSLPPISSPKEWLYPSMPPCSTLSHDCHLLPQDSPRPWLELSFIVNLLESFFQENNGKYSLLKLSLGVGCVCAASQSNIYSWLDI